MAALSKVGVLEVGAMSGGGCRFVDGAVVAGLWALLKLGRLREGRTVADRESKEKRESAGVGALDVANGCGLKAESPCSAVRGDAGAEGEGFGLMDMKRSVKEKQAADERAERSGTTLVSVRHGAELGLLKLWCSWRLVWLLLGWRGCLGEDVGGEGLCIDGCQEGEGRWSGVWVVLVCLGFKRRRLGR